ncbi:MAG: hypothetical protein J0I12_20720 [Candidatus Eremiobacteraeota bacterium]|nr:hypothetical protein [Candidatus Eremiobacteraeota bacterium]
MKSIKIGLLLVTGFLAVATFGCSSTPPAGGTATPGTASPAAPATP